jgi:hypothetical protein
VSLDVYVVNESTRLSDQDAYKIAWALNYQAQFHAGRSGWRSDVRVFWVQRGVQPIILDHHAILHFIDNADVQGALGYHDEDGNEVPYARVFVETTQQSGGQVSEVASHELLELMADPHINLTAMTGDGSRIYAVEVGDPVQGTAYDIGAPEGKSLGVQVANFALPAYFDSNSQPGRKVDFRGILSAPFTIAPQGYMSYIDTANFAAGWQSAWGSERKQPPSPDVDDRNKRRVSLNISH